MKSRPFFLAALVALSLTMFSCVGNVTISDDGIAYAVFQLIPEGDYDVHFRGKTYTCPDDCTRHFGDEIEYDDYGNQGTESFDVDCFPMDSGGWLAVLSRYGCFDYCAYGRGKAYVYKDGVLTEAPDMLPTPLYKGEEPDKIFYQRYCSGTQLIVMISGLETDEWNEPFVSQETTYKWDGSRFVEVSNQLFENEKTDDDDDAFFADDDDDDDDADEIIDDDDSFFLDDDD